MVSQLEARGVSVTLSHRRVVADADLVAPAGQFTAILGPNGSGKTTLLRALSGELKFIGLISLNGQDIRTLKPWQAASLRAVLPQSTTLSFPFTVHEVVAMGVTSGLSRLPEHLTRTLPHRALARVDLSDFASRLYQDLSGGEQQRVQLARVLCQVWSPVVDGVPRYLLLDEPVSSLDIKHQLAILRLARSFADAGGGVIAILHDFNLAAMFADRIVVMSGGRVVAAGTPGETLSDTLISAVFDVPLSVGAVPNGVPFVLPQSWAAAPVRTPSRS
jgi:iron complex transport system ATP-binding protein